MTLSGVRPAPVLAQSKRWKHTAQGGWGERGQDPLARGDTSPSLVGLSAFMVGNGGGLEMLSWGFALQPCTACEDQECRVCGCPEELVLPQVLVYLLAQLSAEPFSCVPSPEGVKTAFLGHKRLAYPWWRNYSWKRNATFKNHTAVKVLLNIKVGVMAAEYQR